MERYGWRRDQILLTRGFHCCSIPSSCSLTVTFQWEVPTFSLFSLFCSCWDVAETVQTMSCRHRCRRAERWQRRKQKNGWVMSSFCVYFFFFCHFFFLILTHLLILHIPPRNKPRPVSPPHTHTHTLFPRSMHLHASDQKITFMHSSSPETELPLT